MKTSAVFCWLVPSTLATIFTILLLTEGNNPSEISTSFSIASFNMTAFNSQHAELQLHNVAKSDVYTIYLTVYCKGNYEKMGEPSVKYTTCGGFDELARDFERMKEIWPSSILEQMRDFFENAVPPANKRIIRMHTFALILIATQLLSGLIMLCSNSPILHSFTTSIDEILELLLMMSIIYIFLYQKSISEIAYANRSYRGEGIGISVSKEAGLLLLSLGALLSAFLMFESWTELGILT